MTDLHLAYTNRKRKEINDIMMKKVYKTKYYKGLKLEASKFDKNSQDVNKANVIKDFNNNFNLVAELENQGWQHFLDINGYTPQLNNASVKVDFLPSSPVAASEQKMIGSIGKNALSGVDVTSLAMASYLAKKILRPAANISVSASKVVSSKINTRE